MAKIDFAFHATQNEVIEVIKNSILEYNLYLVSMQLSPEFGCEIIDKKEFDSKINIIENSRMILLYNYKPDISLKDCNNFFMKNNDSLLFEIGT